MPYGQAHQNEALNLQMGRLVGCHEKFNFCQYKDKRIDNYVDHHHDNNNFENNFVSDCVSGCFSRSGDNHQHDKRSENHSRGMVASQNNERLKKELHGVLKVGQICAWR